MSDPISEYVGDSQPIGSVGSLVSAVLETAGHSMQSAVLDFFHLGFAHDFGILLYLLAAITGLFIYAVGGNYKFGLWFFIGPTLFYFLLYPRFPSKGVHWKLGRREFSQVYVDKITEGVTERSIKDRQSETNPKGARPDEANKVGDVSWFFAGWDNFTSGIVNAFVSLLRLDVGKIDLSFISKTQRYNTLLSLDIQDHSLKAFVNLLMATQCNQYFGLMKDYYAANERINSSEEIRQRFKTAVLDIEGKEVKVEKNDPAIQAAFEAKILYDFNPDAAKAVPHPGKTPVSQASEFKDHPLCKETAEDDPNNLPEQITDQSQLKDHYSCEEIWKLGINSLKMHANNLYFAVASTNLPPGMTAQDVEEQIKAKVKTCTKHYIKPPVSQAEGKDPAVPYSEDPEGDYCVECLDENQKLLVFVNEMATRMFFKELQKIEKNIVQAEFDKEYPKEFWAKDNQVAHDLREAYQGLEYESKGLYLSSMLAIPYLQGITLYFLGLTYPFFAMAMIWPGRHWALLRWMALWFWVKSWDIGFAIVMMVDELLYNLMPHGPPVTNLTDRDPAEALKTILEIDPSYTVNTYFNIMATLIGAVPLLTGVLVKKGGGEIVHAVAQGYQNFSGKIGFAMMQYHLSLRNQDLSERVTKGEINAFGRAIVRSLKDKDVLAAIGGEVAAKTILSRLSKPGEDAGKISQVMGDIQKFLVSNEGSRYLKGLAMAKFETNIRHAIYNESTRVENLQLVHDAVLNYYSNHDWIIANPYAADFKYKQAQIDFRPGAAWGNTIFNALGRTFGVGPKPLKQK